MTRLVLELEKSIEQNASEYFEKSKKAKKKLKGAEEALQRITAKLEKAKKQSQKAEAEREKAEEEDTKPAKKEWYEKFRWFISSEGFLVIGGRDATTNEIVVKKHADKDDVVFHTDMAGSSFFVIKADSRKVEEKGAKEGEKIGKATMRETADAACTFSRAFKLGLTRQDVFYVKPEQVTKEAKAGEYLQKGAFMIKGKTNYIDNRINAAVGITKRGRIMAGPVEAVKKNCIKFVEIEQGNEKTSKIAKYIQKRIGGHLDDIIRVMPSGDCRIKK